MEKIGSTMMTDSIASSKLKAKTKTNEAQDTRKSIFEIQKEIKDHGPAGAGIKDKTARNDAKVDISDSVKNFSRIKKAVDLAPELDQSAKVDSLKKQIDNGTYAINYDALADKIDRIEQHVCPQDIDKKPAAPQLKPKGQP